MSAEERLGRDFADIFEESGLKRQVSIMPAPKAEQMCFYQYESAAPASFMARACYTHADDVRKNWCAHCRRTEEMIQQISVPKEGSKPLHFDAQYSKTTWGQFLLLLKKFNTIWWRTPEVRPVIKFPLTRLWRSHRSAPAEESEWLFAAVQCHADVLHHRLCLCRVLHLLEGG